MQTDNQIRQEISRLRKVLRERKRKAHGEPKRRKGMGVRIGDRDEAEKVKRGYVEAGSFVRRDGSEKLVGRDWWTRKVELAGRSRGQCEQIVYVHESYGALRCVADAIDPHHTIKRSVRRDDRLSNLEHLCRRHHIERDPRRLRSGRDGA